MIELLDQASDCIEEIEARYNDGDINDKMQLQPARDAAYSEYHRVRRIGLQAAYQVTAEDRKEMARIMADIQSAANIQATIGVAVRFAGLLKKIV